MLLHLWHSRMFKLLPVNLLAASALARLALVLGMIAPLWLAIVWAVSLP